jgi:hypothetical protein
MRTRGRCGAIAVTLAVCALVVGAFGGGAAARRGAVVASPSGSFADPAGDAAAPDVTTVTIAGDPTNGTFEVSVTAAGMFAIDPALEPDMDVFLNTDRDEETGSGSGCEYDLVFRVAPGGTVWSIDRWDGDAWRQTARSSTMSFTAGGDVLTWRFSKADIGDATGFDFWLASAIYDSAGYMTAEDLGPADGWWTYDPAATPASYSDPAGDAGAPDVTSVEMSGDPVSGTFEVSVTAVGLSAMDRALEPDVRVYLDIDRDDRTGSSSGCEYSLVFWKTPDGTSWYVYHWTDDGWEASTKSSTMSFTLRGDVLTWRFGKADIGNATGFAFWISSLTFGEYDVLAEDVAPDEGRWQYALPVVKPVIRAPKASPAKPAAGKRLTVAFPVVRSDNGKPLTIGKMVCDPSVQGKVISHAESFAKGVARLTFTVPKGAKGKLLKVKVTIKAAGRSATRIATFRVR